jgi:hypothetical protein
MIGVSPWSKLMIGMFSDINMMNTCECDMDGVSRLMLGDVCKIGHPPLIHHFRGCMHVIHDDIHEKFTLTHDL